MKRLNKYILVLLALVVVIPACKDEDLITLPVWQSGVHAFTVVAEGSKADFLSGNGAQDVTFDLLWNSIDGNNKVTKIEVFAYFSEAYIDPDDNPATASHGGADGVSFLTLEGAAVPANKVTTSFTISQDDMYAMYQNASFDYDKDGTATPVWANPTKPNRQVTPNRKFVPGDSFSIRWELTTEDGRLFDSWSPSVCTEFPGANCSVNWAIVCAPEITKPAGDWVIQMQDLYGDGWQGGYVSVIVDGVEVDKAFLLSEYEPGGVAISAGTKTVTVPATATTLTFAWSNDDYNSECVFKIISPSGNVVADVATPSAGKIKLDLCNE